MLCVCLSRKDYTLEREEWDGARGRYHVRQTILHSRMWTIRKDKENGKKSVLFVGWKKNGTVVVPVSSV